MTAERMFPIQVARGSAPHPLVIPWSIAELAFSVYAQRYGGQQGLEAIAERGGFVSFEMDVLVPGWRDRCSEISSLKAHLMDALHEAALAWHGASRLRCPEHEVDASNAWGCPGCVADLRAELAMRKGAAKAKAAELAQHITSLIHAHLDHDPRAGHEHGPILGCLPTLAVEIGDMWLRSDALATMLEDQP